MAKMAPHRGGGALVCVYRMVLCLGPSIDGVFSVYVARNLCTKYIRFAPPAVFLVRAPSVEHRRVKCTSVTPTSELTGHGRHSGRHNRSVQSAVYVRTCRSFRVADWFARSCSVVISVSVTVLLTVLPKCDLFSVCCAAHLRCCKNLQQR